VDKLQKQHDEELLHVRAQYNTQLANTSSQYQRSLDIVIERIKHFETENSSLKGQNMDRNPVVYNLDVQDADVVTEHAVDSFETCGSNLNNRIAKVVNRYSTATGSGSATAIHTGTTIRCPNPKTVGSVVGALGSGPCAGASSGVPNNGPCADGNTVAAFSDRVNDNSGPVNRASPAKKDDFVSISQIRNLSESIGLSHAWKSTHDYVLHTLNRHARETGHETVPERHAPLSPVHVTNLGKTQGVSPLVYPNSSP
jgi:hypothetical protein